MQSEQRVRSDPRDAWGTFQDVLRRMAYSARYLFIYFTILELGTNVVDGKS